jgi:hypothetical protein
MTFSHDFFPDRLKERHTIFVKHFCITALVSLKEGNYIKERGKP